MRPLPPAGLMAQPREFERDDDLRLMQTLAEELWRFRGPMVEHHIGGLAWSAYSAPETMRQARRALWEESGRCLAWGWIDPPSDLAFLVHPDRPELLDDVLHWAQAETTSSLESDAAAVATLRHHGYERAAPDAPFFVQLIHDLVELREPALPDGVVLRHVTGERDLRRRAEVHRAAWSPSRVTVESYRRVMHAYPYREDLDWVVETREGKFAASCLVWLDEANGVAEVEPVGTDPRYARQGLAAAVSLAALRRLREIGGWAAMVHARGDAAYPAPKRLYESIGFKEYVRAASFQKRDATSVRL